MTPMLLILATLLALGGAILLGQALALPVRGTVGLVMVLAGVALVVVWATRRR